MLKRKTPSENKPNKKSLADRISQGLFYGVLWRRGGLVVSASTFDPKVSGLSLVSGVVLFP